MTNKDRGLFMSGVLAIFGSQLIVKLTGFLYRLVITNIDGFGDLGNGFYNAGFQIYTMLLALSSVGIPNAISKLVSAEIAVGNQRRAYEIFRAALLLFFLFGLVCAVALYLGADVLALYMIRMDGVQKTLQALSPAVLFVCISSVIRGYFMGLGNISATSTSQMLEQFIKSMLTILFVFALTGYSAEIMSAGANFATSVAAACGMIYLAIFYLQSNKRNNIPAKNVCTTEKISFVALSRTILTVSVPISLTAIILSISRVIDIGTTTRGIITAFANGIPGQFGSPSQIALNQESVRLSGMLSKSDSLINLPLALNIAFATILVPAISSDIAVGQRTEARKKVEFSFLLSILFILPCSAGLIILAEPIYQFIYPNAPQGYSLLQIAAVGMIFSALNQTLIGSLQGIGKVFIPAKALLFGAAAKIMLNLILIPIPSVNIYGAPVASIVCYLIAFSICFLTTKNILALCLPIEKYLLKPLACTIIMAIGTAFAYRIFQQIFQSNGFSILLTVFCAAALYLFLILRSQILSLQDMAFFPVGDKIKERFERLYRKK